MKMTISGTVAENPVINGKGVSYRIATRSGKLIGCTARGENADYAVNLRKGDLVCVKADFHVNENTVIEQKKITEKEITEQALQQEKVRYKNVSYKETGSVLTDGPRAEFMLENAENRKLFLSVYRRGTVVLTEKAADREVLLRMYTGRDRRKVIAAIDRALEERPCIMCGKEAKNTMELIRSMHPAEEKTAARERIGRHMDLVHEILQGRNNEVYN